MKKLITIALAAATLSACQLPIPPVAPTPGPPPATPAPTTTVAPETTVAIPTTTAAPTTTVVPETTVAIPTTTPAPTTTLPNPRTVTITRFQLRCGEAGAIQADIGVGPGVLATVYVDGVAVHSAITDGSGNGYLTIGASLPAGARNMWITARMWHSGIDSIVSSPVGYCPDWNVEGPPMHWGRVTNIAAHETYWRISTVPGWIGVCTVNMNNLYGTMAAGAPLQAVPMVLNGQATETFIRRAPVPYRFGIGDITNNDCSTGSVIVDTWTPLQTYRASAPVNRPCRFAYRGTDHQSHLVEVPAGTSYPFSTDTDSPSAITVDAHCQVALVGRAS